MASQVVDSVACCKMLHSSRSLAGIHIYSGMQDYKTLYATMKRIADAEPRDLDTWNIGITAGDCRLLATQLPLTVLYSWTKCACITDFPYLYGCITCKRLSCLCVLMNFICFWLRVSMMAKARLRLCQE